MTEAEYPWLVGEKKCIRQNLEANTPVLGICLDSQLIADVIGGRAYQAADTEVGLVSLDMTPDGATDFSLAEITGPVAAWHGDTFDLPPDARVLARTDGYPHAFRYGSALGVQFHPEVTPELWEVWTDQEGTDDLSEAGLDPSAFQGELDDDRERLRSQAVAFFRAWLNEKTRAATELPFRNESPASSVIGAVQRREDGASNIRSRLFLGRGGRLP